MRKNLWTLPRQWARAHPEWLREHAGLDLADPLVREALAAEMGKAEAALAIRAAEWQREYALWVGQRELHPDGSSSPAHADRVTLEKLYVLLGIDGDPAEAYARGEARREAHATQRWSAAVLRDMTLAQREERRMFFALCRLAGWPLLAVRSVCARDGEPDGATQREVFRQACGHARGWRAYPWESEEYPVAESREECVGRYSGRCSYKKYERTLRGGWWQMSWGDQVMVGAGNRVTLPDGRVYQVRAEAATTTGRRKFSAPELVEAECRREEEAAHA